MTKSLKNVKNPIDILSDAHPDMVMKEIRKHLAQCGISSKHAMQPIGSLSGGEQAKGALKEAMINFPGTVLLVSHEENFYYGWGHRGISIEK